MDRPNNIHRRNLDVTEEVTQQENEGEKEEKLKEKLLLRLKKLLQELRKNRMWLKKTLKMWKVTIGWCEGFGQ